MTTKAKTPLVDVLASLITSSEPRKIKPLSGGLLLAYTPGDKNQAEPGIHRLTLSRRGVFPSEQEVRIVQRELLAALKRHGRFASAINWEPWKKGKPTRRADHQIMYHVLFWEELVQGSLL